MTTGRVAVRATACGPSWLTLWNAAGPARDAGSRSHSGSTTISVAAPSGHEAREPSQAPDQESSRFPRWERFTTMTDSLDE
jgi:hypothetical protein